MIMNLKLIKYPKLIENNSIIILKFFYLNFKSLIKYEHSLINLSLF